MSTSKLLAKTVAGLHKPFQQTVLADTPATRRLVLPDDLPLRKVYGIGHSTAQQLASAGVATVGDLRDFSGPSSISDIERLRALARGDDASQVKQTGAPKSIGAEESFWTKPFAVPSERADDALKMLARKLVRKLAVDQKAHGARPFENVQLSARRAAERSGSPRALTSTLAEGPASAQREKTPGREAKSRPARARVGTLTDDAACEALASKLEADAAALLTALYPHGATLSILNLGVTLKTIDAAGHADISSFLTKRKAPAPRPPPPVPAPVAPPHRLEPRRRASTAPRWTRRRSPNYRQRSARTSSASWLCGGRRGGRPRRSRGALHGHGCLARPAPPPPAVDEAAVAQIVSMGFSRKSAVAALERLNGDVQRAIDGLLASSRCCFVLLLP